MPISLIVADESQAGAGLSELLEGADVSIVAKASTGNEAFTKTLEHRPDAVLMDIRMMEGDGIAAMLQIKAHCPEIPVVMLSTSDGQRGHAPSAPDGLRDYALNGSNREELLEAIQNAVRGGVLVAGCEIGSVHDGYDRYDVDPNRLAMPLNAPEMQILRHVALGLSNREIGKSMQLDVDTVKEHVQHIVSKLEVSSRTQAAVWALKNKLV